MAQIQRVTCSWDISARTALPRYCAGRQIIADSSMLIDDTRRTPWRQTQAWACKIHEVAL